MFLKHDCKIKYYLRYCDDFLLFSNDKQFLKDMSVKIEEFVTTKLKLKLSKCNILSTS